MSNLLDQQRMRRKDSASLRDEEREFEERLKRSSSFNFAAVRVRSFAKVQEGIGSLSQQAD